MTKELFVSSTPHETRVGLVEDDQLAEIYLERENEYTLAGSIYKGRVTRVLPGMQSAFVDIGLERDAFLYVSDFMELEDQDELDEIPTDRTSPAPEPRHQRDESHLALPEAQAIASSPEESQPQEHREAGQQPSESGDTAHSGNRERGGWRGRRRRRGRRGERMPDSKFARPAGEAQRETPLRTEPSGRPERAERPERSDRPERADFGPPPGYQPMILPGESISKYSRLAQAQAAAPARAPLPTSGREVPTPPLAQTFPEDEPLFAKPATEDRQQAQSRQTSQSPAGNMAQTGDRKQERFEEMNVAAIFGGGATESEEQSQEEIDEEENKRSPVTEHSDQSPSAAAGTMEEEEIEEEEADLAAYVEELEEDDAFEELEEETHAAADYQETAQEIAAVGDPGIGISEPRAAEPITSEPGVAEVVEEDETDEVEAELDEAQAEAEAVVEAETVGGTVDARAEVRAPAATAPYTQRASRPAFDRNRGRRGGGGRRFRRNEPQNVPLITDLLKEGQEILVQIAKEPIGKKGARITSHIALPGRFLVYMPTVNHTGVSRKISSEDERQRLKRIIISERENGHGGFIVRTAAQGAAEEDLRADIRFLKGLWSEIKSRADNGKGPTLIYHDLNVVERVLRDQVSSDFSAIWVDNEQEYERILRFANRFQPALVKRVKLYTKDTPLYDQFGLNEEINKALKSKVWLKSGGYIVINQTEALVAIDVNTGKYVGKTARLEDTIVKTNVDAIKEIVRQIRLRDLGGIIVIDFIDMDERRNRQKVMQALEEALRGDRAPSKVLQFNDFGLVAITRKRVKQSLERTIGTPCPYCQSTGFVKSVTTICNEIYLEMRKIAKHLEHSDVLLRVNPEVAKALKANNGRALTEMEELTKRTVIVKSDPAVHQEQFDIN
jgi:Rne/Rng family ribonuclease